MAEGKTLLEVVTPERRLISLDVEEVTAPGLWGEFGALPQHTPYLCQLEIGILSYRIGSGRYFVSVIGGYAEVGPNKVTILAETAECAEDIDSARAAASRDRARERMSGQLVDESFDFDRAESSLKRAIGRLRVASQSGMG